MAVVQPPRGRTARTDYRVRKTFAVHKTIIQESDITVRSYKTAAAPLTTQKVNGDLVASLLECRIHTGRTHQIRVHLKHLGYPILGDTLYGGPKSADRPMLHAWKLGFLHPRSGQSMEFCAPLPADFLAFGLDPTTP